MSPKTCRHVHANGALCKSPPLHNRDYCHFHLDQIGRQLRAARARARHQPARLKLPLLEDPFAVQVGLMQVADAITHNEIDVPRGRLLMSVLRLASSNLKTARKWKQDPLFADGDTETAITEWPGFEQENDLPPDFDLSVDPEAAFPLNTTEGLSGVPEQDQADDSALRARIREALGDAKTSTPQVTADQLELMDIYEREGQQAARKFSEQMVRNARRRERRLRRAQFEEQARHHNINIAARRLVEEQREASAASHPSVGEMYEDASASLKKQPQSEGVSEAAAALSSAT